MHISTVRLSICVLILKFCQGMTVKGTLKTDKDWVYLMKFSFDSEDAVVRYKFEYPTVYGVQNLLLYNKKTRPDTILVSSEKSCAQREAILTGGAGLFINLTDQYPWTGCTRETIDESDQLYKSTDDGEIFHCEGGRSLRPGGEPWWYAALSNCYGNKAGLLIRYDLSILNGEGEFKHFSAGQSHLWKMAVGFLVLFIILAVISIAIVVTMETLVKPWKINRTYLIYAVSLGCYMLYLTFLCGYYDNIKRSGIATEGLMVTARLFQHASYAVFVLLLILLSRGYKITRYEFDRVHWLQYGVSSAIYTAIYFSVLLYVIATFDKEVYLYILDYPGSDGILIMRVIAWVWFFVVTIITFCQHVKTRLFYFFYFVLYSGWFLGVPLFVWICRHTATLELTRESLVFGVDHTLNLLAMILYLTIVVFVFERKETPDKFSSPEGMTELGVAEMAACDTDQNVTATASE